MPDTATHRQTGRRATTPGLFRSLFVLMLGFTFVPLVLLSIFVSTSIQTLTTEISGYQLLEHTRLMARVIEDRRDAGVSPVETLTSLGPRTSFRLSLIGTDGRVLYDSIADASTMENHKARPEVRAALESGEGSNFRKSGTTQVETSYAAIRLDLSSRGDSTYILRTALPLPLVAEQLARQNQNLYLAMVWILAAGLVAAIIFSARIKKPVAVLESAARSWAEGKFDTWTTVRSPREFANLSLSMNAMARELRERLDAYRASRNELATILDAMGEGLIVTDATGTISRSNPEAGRIFAPSTSPEQALSLGMGVLDATRCPDLAALEIRCRKGSHETATIVLYRDRPVTIRAQGAPLPDGHGAVLVLSDVSRMVQLENVRRDFVANVSHELKTPIQSIKGFAEALLDQEGAGGSEESDTRKHLGIILRNTLRMEAIIADLLALARLEYQESQGPLPGEALKVAELCTRTLGDIRIPADRSRDEITMEGDPDTVISARPGLVEQALVNLVDNALRYTAPGTPIQIRWTREGTWVHLSVSDQGPGIPVKDQDRIFERFYRIEKSRTRESGGTGLGLAIVYHVARVHGGRAWVQSVPGQGATFTLSLPAL